jgi:hypothetical protein
MASTPHSPNTRKSSVERGASGASSGRRQGVQSGQSGQRRQSGQRGRAKQRNASATSSARRTGSARVPRGKSSSAAVSSAADGRRKPSKRQQRIYRRRRIVVLTALVVALALIALCFYSLGRGVVAISDVIRHDDLTALVRREVPSAKHASGVRDCTAGDVRLELSEQSQTIPVGGSVDFTMTVAYKGSGSCLIDVSNASRVLTITSGEQTIWKSDACPADPHMLLMSKGDKRVDTLTWNADSTGSECVDDADLPRVNPGTYVAKLSLKNDAAAVSDPVPVIVQ